MIVRMDVGVVHGISTPPQLNNPIPHQPNIYISTFPPMYPWHLMNSRSDVVRAFSEEGS